MAEDDDMFIDADAPWNKEKGIAYEQIVLLQMKRCSEEASKEMRGSYLKTDKNGNQEYVPDQRKVYIQCMKTLYDLLTHHFDEKMTEEDVEFNNEEKKVKDDIFKLMKEQIKVSNDMRVKKKLQYQIDTGYLDQDDYYYNLFLDNSIDNYRFMFQALVRLFIRKRFLLGEVIYD